MVEIATQEAFDAIPDFAQDVEQAKQIALYLCEVPIGDEYHLLTSDDWTIGAEFELYLKNRGIKAFEKAGL